MECNYANLIHSYYYIPYLEFFRQKYLKDQDAHSKTFLETFNIKSELFDLMFNLNINDISCLSLYLDNNNKTFSFYKMKLYQDELVVWKHLEKQYKI